MAGEAAGNLGIERTLEDEELALNEFLPAALKQFRSAQVMSAGHAFVQNRRRSHYELGMDTDRRHRLRAIFAELTRAI